MISRILSLVVILITTPCIVFCQSFTKAIDANEKLIAEFVQKNNIPGLSIAIAVNKKIVWSKGFGYANLELKVPVTNETKFRIASLSKSFTGTAIALLADKGLLDLNDPVSKYLDNIPKAWDSITIYNICEHSSGIAHYENSLDALDTVFYASTAAALNRFKDRPLLHAPGEKRSYSSYAYTVLAAIIEKVSGKDFLSFMKDEIFTPLQMKNTVPDIKNNVIDGRPGFYSYGPKNEIIPAPYVDLSSRWAGSGYLSTAEDLAMFGAAHTSAGFLLQKTFDLLFKAREFKNGSTAAETLAWGPRKDWEGRRMLWNNGGTPGCTGGLLIFPDQGISIAVLCNVNGAPFDRGEIQSIALRFLAAIEKQQVSELTAAETGTYEISLSIEARKYDGKLQLVNEGNKISGYLDLPGLQKFHVADAFKIKDKVWIAALGGKDGAIGLGILPAQIEFKTDGTISGTVFRIGGTIEGKKEP